MREVTGLGARAAAAARRRRRPARVGRGCDRRHGGAHRRRAAAGRPEGRPRGHRAHGRAAGRRGARLPRRPGARPVRPVRRPGRRGPAAAGRAERARRAAGARRAESADFGLWVCLHEATHRLQFTAVPWLRTYFARRGRAVPVARGRHARRDPRAAAGGVSAIAESGGDSLCLVELLQGPEQRAVLDRLLALTTLLEGHADHVMDAVGPEVVPERWRRSGRGSPSAVAAGAWSTGCCARCSASRRRCAVRRGVGVHQARRARGGDGRVQQGVGVARDAADPRGAGRPRAWLRRLDME